MKGSHKILIIGGVATGPKAAARTRRLLPEAEITIIERGGLVSYGGCGLPFYLSGLVPDLRQLVSTNAGLVRDTDFFLREKNVRVLTRTLAESIDRENRRVAVVDLPTGERRWLDYDRLVLATGAEPVVPAIEGINHWRNVFTLHHPDDAVRIRELIKSKQVRQAVVIGAGLIGLEVADALAGQRIKVTVVEIKDQILPNMLDDDMAVILRREIEQRKVEVLTATRVTALDGDAEGKVRRVSTTRGELEADLVVVACGVKPNVSLAQAAGLALGRTGAIYVNEYLQTSDPVIYAGGDCVENMHLVSREMIYLPLASTANKHGRVIGDNLAGRRERFGGVLGTSALQAFDQNTGRTGLGEQEACRLGYRVVTAVTPSTDCAHYYPMHSGLMVKLVAEAGSGRLLGAQVLGEGEAIKRLDVLATAITFGGTLDTIAKLDLGYAPPFATAIDVAAHAANTARNKAAGLAEGIPVAKVSERLAGGKDVVLLDVRQPEEVEDRGIRDGRVLHIPLGELRQRMREVPRDKEIITLCELGVRGYEAVRILSGAGFPDVKFMDGGLAAWQDTPNSP
ncbi:pyridine nucleotide-disulfide oxidoreductase [Clostridiales bacterium PH28_bin88]|nr:pyridine nucleotide-disulfide oxidoreductase [Clostridiales bacterium PH28_bin88]